MMVGCVVRFVGASPTQNEQGQPVGSFDLKFTTQQRRRLGFGTQPIRSGSQRPPFWKIPKSRNHGVAVWLRLEVSSCRPHPALGYAPAVGQMRNL